MTWIQTANGKSFDYTNLDPRQWDIEFIARGLANTCRFAGQLPYGVWYSVAEHSIHVSRMVPPEHALAGLLHDAVESVMGDIPTPLKQLIPEFSTIEDQLGATLAVKFGLTAEIPPEVKQADREILLAERDDICGGAIAPWALDKDVKARRPEGGFQCWRPTTAELFFCERFQELQGVKP